MIKKMKKIYAIKYQLEQRSVSRMIYHATLNNACVYLAMNLLEPKILILPPVQHSF